MLDRQIYIVAGLGYGDEGKGTITEFLTKAFDAKAVVRYNGGPQAAHHVVRREGLFHCFSQFGSGSFFSGVQSHLAHTVLVKPSNLFVELACIREKGAEQIHERFSLDPACYLVTPWHAMIGRMEELVRGSNRHGSVGMGVGKAANDRAICNPNALIVSDLLNPETIKSKLSNLWEFAQLQANLIISNNRSNTQILNTFEYYKEMTAPLIMYNEYLRSGELLVNRIKADCSFAHNYFGNIVLEGAQGVLLDYKYGFSPHVTKTDTSFNSATSFIETAGLSESKIFKVGVLRAYATRHGAGPFVTEDHNLESFYPELHNAQHPWQGAFRLGHFDLVASRYALRVSGVPDFIALTHLDRIGKESRFLLCNSYSYLGSASSSELEEFFELESNSKNPVIKEIKYRTNPSVEYQSKLTKLLVDCVPKSFIEFEGWANFNHTGMQELPATLMRFIDYLQSARGLSCPVRILSFGPTLEDKFFIPRSNSFSALAQ